MILPRGRSSPRSPRSVTSRGSLGKPPWTNGAACWTAPSAFFAAWRSQPVSPASSAKPLPSGASVDIRRRQWLPECLLKHNPLASRLHSRSLSPWGFHPLLRRRSALEGSTPGECTPWSQSTGGVYSLGGVSWEGASGGWRGGAGMDSRVGLGSGGLGSWVGGRSLGWGRDLGRALGRWAWRARGVGTWDFGQGVGIILYSFG